MEEFLKEDKFVQFILDTYLPTSEIDNEEKIRQVFSSMEEFNLAMESYLLVGAQNTRRH